MAATNGGSQSHSSVTAHCVELSAAQASTARPVSCCSAVRSPSPCCAARLLFRRISAWRPVSCSLALAAVCVRLAAAGQAQSDTNSQTADSGTVTYKKVFKLFPVHPGPPRGEQCSSSVRALQSLGTYTYTRRLGRTAADGPRARAGAGPIYTVPCKAISYMSTIVHVSLEQEIQDATDSRELMACPRRPRRSMLAERRLFAKFFYVAIFA